MEENMFTHPATQANLETLVRRGVTIVGPERGRLASGAAGVGRMASPEAIFAAVRKVLRGAGPLTGSHVVVTAGGTREPLDPVRFIGNRSSGKMGYALAAAAIDAGADVTLISGPSDVEPPAEVDLVRVETAQELLEAVSRAVSTADVLLMAAAVADFRPATPSRRKIKKEAGVDELAIRLVRNPDILAAIERPGLLKIGFAAETEDLVTNARRKLAEKGLGLIVANDAVSSIGADESEATLVYRDGTTIPLPKMSKQALASEIVRAISNLLAKP
jgi:phosphopantothenoylcysteine decarboxylase/phosphopantothenate--cysteine ligase